MLAIYRRHQSPCKYTSRRFRNCKCPIWVQGSLRGEYVRRSLDLRSWEAASELVRGWEASGEVGVVKPEVPTVAEAVTKFIEDANARHLAGETVRKYSLYQPIVTTWAVYDCSGLKSQLIAEGLESAPLKVYHRKVWAAVQEQGTE